MPALAKILLVGTSVATVAFATAASSQQVVTGQIQVGDIFAGQVLEVIDPAEGVGLTTGAQANALEVEGHVFSRSSQTLEGTVRAESEAVIHGWSPNTAVLTAAAGNTVDASADHGSVRAETDQTIGSGLVTAWTGVTSVPSSSGDTTAMSVAVGNNVQAQVDGEDANVDAVQRHLGGGSKARVEAEIAHAMWSSQLSAVAAANQVSVQTGTGYTGLQAEQTSTSATEASVAGSVYSGQTVNGMAAAMANTVDVAQQGWGVEARTRQTNTGYVSARTDLVVGEFGEVAASAIGVANSVSASVEGAMLTLDTEQTNSGGVEVAATLDGGWGYDAQLSASAIGNAVAGTLCADCDGELTATNSQTNNGNVSAVAGGHVGTAAGVRSTANAVGNSAVYRVTKPN